MKDDLKRYAWALLALFMTVMYVMESNYRMDMTELASRYEASWAMCHNEAMPLLDAVWARLRMYQ